MFTQEGITKTVIDSALRFSQRRDMLTHEEILAELIRQIDAEEVKQVDVARALGIAAARVAEMRKGTRRIQPQEMEPLARFLKMIGEDPETTKTILSSHLIPHLGQVAQGVWMEESYIDPDRPEYVHYDRAAGDPVAEELFSVTPVGASMNLLFTMPGIKLICQRVPFGIAELRNEDLVVVERTAHELREMTCKIVQVDNAGVYWLLSKSDQPQFQEPWRIGKPNEEHHDDVEIRIIGKVLRGVIDYTKD